MSMGTRTMCAPPLLAEACAGQATEHSNIKPKTHTTTGARKIPVITSASLRRWAKYRHLKIHCPALYTYLRYHKRPLLAGRVYAFSKRPGVGANRLPIDNGLSPCLLRHGCLGNTNTANTRFAPTLTSSPCIPRMNRPCLVEKERRSAPVSAAVRTFTLPVYHFTPIDVKDLAGHIGRVVRGQEYVTGRYLLRLPGPLHRHVCTEALHFVGRGRGRNERCPHRPRCHTIDANALLNQRHRK